MSIVIVGGNEHMGRLISVVLSVAKVSVILPSVTNVSVVSFVLSLFVEHADKSFVSVYIFSGKMLITS